MAETRQLGVIKKPAEGTRTVLVAEVTPIVKGEGDLIFTCGGCRTVLLDGVEQGQVSNVVIRCPCGAHNQTLD